MTPSLADRFRLVRRAMMGALTGVLPNTVGYDMLRGVWPGAAGSPPGAGTRERLGSYASTPWMHAVADKVASAFAAVEWKLFVLRPGGQGPARRSRELQKATGAHRARLVTEAKQAGALVALAEHPLTDMLEAANGYQTGQAMRKTWMLHWDLSGDAFLLKERNGLGVPTALWPIPPHWIMWTPTPDRRTFRVSFRGWQGEIPDTEFLWISNPNPENPYTRGVGMAQALADEIETDEYAAKTSRQIFLNTMRPDYLVFPKEGNERPSWSEPERARLEEQWRAEHQGFWRIAKPKFLSREVGVYEFGPANFRQQQFVQLREFERDLIRQTWGVPPEIMGIIAPGSARATIERSEYVFTRWVILPRLEFFRAALQEFLVPEYDDRLILDFESPIEDDRTFALSSATAAPWALTTDEWRHMAQLPPLAGGTGAVHMVPLTLTPTSLGSAATEVTHMATAELLRVRRALEPEAPPPPPRPIDVHVAAPVVNVAAPAVTVPITVPAPGPTRREYRRDDKGLIVGHVERLAEEKD